MRFITLVLLMLTTFAVQADLLVSLQAYENKKYSEAKAGFITLLPLGNPDAAFNLGVMAYYGEGQEINRVEALSYFLLAEKLQHPDASAIVQRVYAEASSDERVQADAAAAKAFAAAIIKQDAQPYHLSKEQPPAAINTPMPIIPEEVTRKNPFGFIVLQYLVDGTGRVQVVDVLDSFPVGAYDFHAMRELRRWEYAATGRPHLMSVQLNFWIAGVMDAGSANRIVNQNNLWTYAQAGSARYQETLGSALNVISMVSGALVYVDKDLSEPGDKLDLTTWFDSRKLKINIEAFDGEVTVQTNAKGEIERVLQSDELIAPEAETLLGMRIRGGKEGIFRLSNSTKQERTFSRLVNRPTILIQQYVPVHEQLTAEYWWRTAATNGDRRAQRILGAKREDWQFYLIQQQDPLAAAWHGARLWLDGEKTEAKVLLEQAQAAGYKPATELLQILSL